MYNILLKFAKYQPHFRGKCKPYAQRQNFALLRLIRAMPSDDPDARNDFASRLFGRFAISRWREIARRE